jgi:hypothetical protein
MLLCVAIVVAAWESTEMSELRVWIIHAGVLLLMSLLCYTCMTKTALPAALKHATCATPVTGAVLLVCAIAVLYGSCTVWREA